MHKKEIIAITVFLFLVISLMVFYFTNYGNITGAAIAEAKEKNIFYGIYSIKPSFKISVDYDLEEYKTIINGLKEISKCAKDGTPVETCITRLEMPDYEWSLGCEKGAEKVFYDFAEFYQSCFDSQDNDCICKLNLDYSKEEIERYKLAGEYKIKLEQDYNKGIINLRLEEPKLDLEHTIKNNNIISWNPLEYSIGYKDNKKESNNLIFYDELTGKTYNLDNINEMILYKFDDRYKDKKQNEVQFVKLKGNKAIFVNKEEKEVENLRICNIKPENIYKFCVTSNKQFYVFDKSQNKPELKNIVIKFAAYVEDLPPPPVENIEVRDKLVDDDSVIIKWDKSKAEDVAKYNIYYAKSDLGLFDEGKPFSEIKNNENLNKKELDITKTDSKEIEGLILDNCKLDFDKKRCVYTTGKPEGIILEKEKLYLFKDPLLKEFYIYVLPVEDDVEYDFSVTAVDKNGNEIDNVKENQKLKAIKNKKSIDDLPIDSKGIASPIVLYTDSKFLFYYDKKREHLNIDGTKADDFDKYKVYYYKSSNLNSEQIKETQNELLNKPLSELAFLFEFNPAEQEQFKSPDQIILGKEDYYFFVIVAIDKNNNPKESMKPKELGVDASVYYPMESNEIYMPGT